ncbi:hypothetical protein ATK30_5447 [Amycolatopsis echigonensis]|uniref:Uncharacterized protein n=1 Tax=Amycolatopsis echigonensis TaxID=2576905 RepID=A0A2N3WL25_9PSEU|nr:hypothetical protein [Amycolatopsis niigatensis]PKV94568.1 hypothetical protein ATK30_5447 [Amycolatopsis niigatensis]
MTDVVLPQRIRLAIQRRLPRSRRARGHRRSRRRRAHRIAGMLFLEAPRAIGLGHGGSPLSVPLGPVANLDGDTRTVGPAVS